MDNHKKLYYYLKLKLKVMEGKKFLLIDEEGKPYLSTIPGKFGGNKRLKIYGKLDCPSAERWIKKGYYVNNRVFFLNEQVAVANGYRPCAICMPNEYKEWKNNQKVKKLKR